MNRNGSNDTMRSMLFQVNDFAERGCWAPVSAVVLPALERVLAERPRLLLGFREDRELPDAFASSLGGARSSCRIEHPLDHRGVLSAVGSITELAAEIGGADGGDGFDPVIGGRGRDDVAAGGADPEGPYMVGVNVVAHAEKGDGGLDVLDTLFTATNTGSQSGRSSQQPLTDSLTPAAVCTLGVMIIYGPDTS